MDKLAYDEYCARHGVAPFPPSFPEFHFCARVPTEQSQRAASDMVCAALADWQAQRDALRARYDVLVAQGAITPPTSTERLQRIAQGSGDQAEAARRVLAKRAARLGLR